MLKQLCTYYILYLMNNTKLKHYTEISTEQKNLLFNVD